MKNLELFNKLLDEGKLKWSEDVTCSTDGCDNPLVEPFVWNSTSKRTGNFICDECDEQQTQVAIAKATISNLEYSTRTDK